MSDVLHALNLHNYKQNILFTTEKDPSYANKAVVQQQNIALTVYIPHEYLVHWYDLKQDNKLGECSFVQLLNVFVSRHGIQINKNCTRINGILRRYCGEVKSKLKSTIYVAVLNLPSLLREKIFQFFKVKLPVCQRRIKH